MVYNLTTILVIIKNPFLLSSGENIPIEYHYDHSITDQFGSKKIPPVESRIHIIYL